MSGTTMFTAVAWPTDEGWSVKCDQAATVVDVVDLATAAEAMRDALAEEMSVDPVYLSVSVREGRKSPGL